MKKSLSLFTIFLALAGVSVAQTYLQPTVGVQNTYNGACLVSTCSGTSYDNGGAGGNYAANINAIYRTFCPNTAGMCMRATFTSFSMNDTYFLCFGPNSCCDYLQILNGPAQNSPALYNNCTVSPGTITASNPSGCLTFRHTTDGSVQLAGWAATLSCVACAGGPSGTTNSDCQFATPVCSNIAINDASNGPGIVAEGCSGCNTSEVYTNWYRITIATSGTLAFTIDPNLNSDDFDPVVYGPNVTCGALGSPVRCSYAASAGNGNTGLGNGAVDNSEDVAGDQWVAPLNVTAGQTYYILINGWSATSGSNGFALNWTGTAGLNCAILPMEVVSFTGEYVKEGNANEIVLQTGEESNLSNITVEKNLNGNWERVHDFAPGGSHSMYIMYDPKPLAGRNEYRARFVDNSGANSFSEIITVMAPMKQTFYLYPNPAAGQLTIEGKAESAVANEIEILNPLGEVVVTIPVVIENGKGYLETVDVSQFSPGVYYVRVGEETLRFTKN